MALMPGKVNATRARVPGCYRQCCVWAEGVAKSKGPAPKRRAPENQAELRLSCPG